MILDVFVGTVAVPSICGESVSDSLCFVKVMNYLYYGHVMASKLDDIRGKATHVDDSEEVSLSRDHAKFGILLVVDQSGVGYWFHSLSDSFGYSLIPV